MASDPAGLPRLPDPTPAEALRDLDAAGLTTLAEELATAERATLAAMAPYDRVLREVRARAAELATERRRRERAERHAARVAVREQAGTETMPGVAEVLGAGESPLPADRPLREIRAYLRTGGEVGFGFATKPGVMTFTDGRRTSQATTLGDARRLWSDGWEPGAPGALGVRVHLLGTRVERLVPPDDVVIALTPG